MSLNGWQRLWVVMTTLWLLGSAVVLWNAFQPRGRTELHPETHPPDLDSKFRPTHTLSEAEFITAKERALKAQAHLTTEQAIADAETAIVVIRDDDGNEFEFIPGTDPKIAAAAVRRYKRVRGGQFLASWLVPPLGLYALGWAVGWVYRGFTARGSR